MHLLRKSEGLPFTAGQCRQLISYSERGKLEQLKILKDAVDLMHDVIVDIYRGNKGVTRGGTRGYEEVRGVEGGLVGGEGGKLVEEGGKLVEEGGGVVEEGKEEDKGQTENKPDAQTENTSIEATTQNTAEAQTQNASPLTPMEMEVPFTL